MRCTRRRDMRVNCRCSECPFLFFSTCLVLKRDETAADVGHGADADAEGVGELLVGLAGIGPEEDLDPIALPASQGGHPRAVPGRPSGLRSVSRHFAWASARLLAPPRPGGAAMQEATGEETSLHDPAQECPTPSPPGPTSSGLTGCRTGSPALLMFQARRCDITLRVSDPDSLFSGGVPCFCSSCCAPLLAADCSGPISMA